MFLTFITGKGGVGKSAVTAALADVLAESGRKVAVIELGETRMADFFDAKPPDYKGVRLSPNLTLFNFQANDCFEEYAARLLPRRALILLKNRWVEHFVHAVPGLNEILLLGKIAALAEETDLDHLLIDAPATGHTVSLCDAPRVALAALKHGPLKTTVEKIWETIHRPQKTGFLLVTELEESIVQETIDLYHHLQESLGLHWRGMIINGVRKNDAEIPNVNAAEKTIPAYALPLLHMLKEEQIRRKIQNRLVRELRETIDMQTGQLTWEGTLESESALRTTLATQIKSVVSWFVIPAKAGIPGSPLPRG